MGAVIPAIAANNPPIAAARLTVAGVGDVPSSQRAGERSNLTLATLPNSISSPTLLLPLSK